MSRGGVGGYEVKELESVKEGLVIGRVRGGAWEVVGEVEGLDV